MQPLLPKHLRYICLILLTASSLSGALTRRHHEQPTPAPCDQLSQASYRERCTRFLADREAVGCQTFGSAITVTSQEELESGLVQDTYGDGIILQVAHDFEIRGLTESIPALGTVAIIGDPDLPPEIIISGSGGGFPVIAADYDSEAPGALFCWGVEWISNSPGAVLYTAAGFGTVHILHSVFRPDWHSGITTDRHSHYHLYIAPRNRYGRGKDFLLIAHNRFYGAPVTRLDKSLSSHDIFINCTRSIPTCHEAGRVVIRDNAWHGHSPYAEDVNYSAVKITDMDEVTFSGNRAVNNDTVLSVYIGFANNVPENSTFIPDYLNLQLVNNSALPGVSPAHRQFYLDGKARDGSDFPLAGVVNITCNPDFTTLATGSFAKTGGYNLSIALGNNYCGRFTEGDFESTPQCQATIINTGNTTDTMDTPDDPGHSRDNDDHDRLFFISAYTLGATTVSLATLSWEMFWALVYHHTCGKAQLVANVLALCIPGFFHRVLKPAIKDKPTP